MSRSSNRPPEPSPRTQKDFFTELCRMIDFQKQMAAELLAFQAQRDLDRRKIENIKLQFHDLRDEIERINKENAALKEQLAHTQKPKIPIKPANTHNSSFFRRKYHDKLSASGSPDKKVWRY